ncbi:MAG: hypothetical protein HFH65_05040 [Lachnospiraceae bacterium]|jgi:hypothetical protein|nr:hypothetical protein [Lachnospiraceae bacterium]
MKKRIISFFSSFLLIAAVLLLNFDLSAFAVEKSGTVTVGKNSIMKQAALAIPRSGRYSYASVRADSVYPVGNYDEDNYTQCLTRIYHNTIGNKPISDIYKLTEGYGYYKIYFYDGWNNVSVFDLCFAGNNPNLSAHIAYTYDGN